MDVFWAAPVVSRTLTAAAFAQSLLVHGGLMNVQLVLFHLPWIFKIFPDVWRLVTPFLLTGPGFDFIFDLYFLYKYATGLERDSPRFPLPGDFFIYIVFVGTVIMIMEADKPQAFCRLHLRGHDIHSRYDKAVRGLNLDLLISLITALMYTYGQVNIGTKASFYVVQIPIELLPWATIILTMVLKGWPTAQVALCGIVAAHLYEFLTRIYPTFGHGRNFIRTPAIVKRWFGAQNMSQTHRAYGTSYRPADRETQDRAATASGNSWFSRDTWNGRGAGRRLG
ncbi:centromere/microtubule-binding protein cbf5 [Onygenales sp. PD_40]|nr:centromere/microtubule-binding protein cbf5 [Onygenales sp. PD_40]